MMYYLLCKREDRKDTLLVSPKRSVLINYYQSEMPFCDTGDGVKKVKDRAELARAIRDMGTPPDVRHIKAYDVDFYVGKEILQVANRADPQK